MLALLYILGPPIAFLTLVGVLYAIAPPLAWMLIGLGWYLAWREFH